MSWFIFLFAMSIGFALGAAWVWFNWLVEYEDAE